MSEHTIARPIRSIQINDHYGSGPDGCGEAFDVGKGGITRIEACEKSGMYSSIPYLRVWKGDDCVAEFCQHNIIGVYFEPTREEVLADAERSKAMGLSAIVDGKCITCGEPALECNCIPF